MRCLRHHRQMELVLRRVDRLLWSLDRCLSATVSSTFSRTLAAKAREWKSLDPLPHARSMQSTIADDAVSYVTAPQH
jgi:hypothetical protein